MIRILVIFIIALGSALPAMSQRQRTTIKIAKPTVKREFSRSDNSPLKQAAVPEDTLTEASSGNLNEILHLAGYDKPLNASRETLHVKNLTADTVVSGFQLDITYLDARGRNLHRRQLWVNAMVEPGETQLVTFPTWDVQRSFYYWRSPKPRRLSAPYNVRINITAITVPLHDFSATDSKLPTPTLYPGTKTEE